MCSFPAAFIHAEEAQTLLNYILAHIPVNLLFRFQIKTALPPRAPLSLPLCAPLRAPEHLAVAYYAKRGYLTIIDRLSSAVPKTYFKPKLVSGDRIQEYGRLHPATRPHMD